MDLIVSTTEPITTPAGTFRVKIIVDEFAESPRDWSNVGSMVLGHRRYDLPSADEEITAALRGEVEVYDRWSQGGFCGYVVERLTDPFGDEDPDEGEWDEVEDGALWGIDSAEYAEEEARAFIAGLSASDFPSPA